jgi:hypothetical protein
MCQNKTRCSSRFSTWSFVLLALYKWPSEYNSTSNWPLNFLLLFILYYIILYYYTTHPSSSVGRVFIPGNLSVLSGRTVFLEIIGHNIIYIISRLLEFTDVLHVWMRL